MEKLIKIQSELKAPKNQFNNFGKYKYRSCEDILEAVKPLLLKYKCTLTISDEVKDVAGVLYIQASVVFSDGENAVIVNSCAGIDINKKGMDISQTFGASSSYARKYALNGLFLIDDTKDADTTQYNKDDVLKSLKSAKSKDELKAIYNSLSTNLKKEYKEIITEIANKLN